MPPLLSNYKKLVMKNILFVTGIVFAAMLFTQCSSETNAAPATEDAVPVRTQPITTSEYTPQLNYSGTIASTSEARLSFKVGGIISKIYVKEGDAVTRGQLLATLDLTEINAQVQQAAQGLEKARRDAQRARNLYNDTVATLEQLQNATTQQQIAEENLRIAQFNQQYAQIRATENGTILRKLMNEGEMASPGAPVFFLAGNSGSDWVVRLGVADKDWAILKKGDKAEVQVDAYPGKIFSGIITEIAQGADPLSGTYEVEVKVSPEGHRFATGLFATVQLRPASKQTVTMVPIEAIAEADDKTGYVFTLNADKQTVTRHKVTIAFLEKDRAAISSGLEDITEVIAEGVGYLTPQSSVKLVHDLQSP
jgi:multidrug efflux system membrane fusion protein